MNGTSQLRHLRKYFEWYRKTSTAEFHGAKHVHTVKQLELDRCVATAIDRGLYHARNHPGVLKKKCDELPTEFVHAIEVITEGRKKSEIVKEAEKLGKQLWGRHMPPEKEDYVEQFNTERKRIKLAIEEIGHDTDHEIASKIEEKIVTRRLKDLIHPWHPLGVTPETCLHYLIARTAAEYCIIHKIFSEICSSDPSFVPHTFFDFGSGVASGYWAARKVWQEPLQEVVNVDSNLNMNDLASKILEIAGEHCSAKKGIFFRQFFPVAPERTYDIALSAFSLLELPSFKERMEAVALLWSKTYKYLIIVEDGTIAGYNAVMEARNLVTHLETSNDDGIVGTGVHVAAPCPHDLLCPRFIQETTPCNFEISYLTPRFLEGKQIRRKHRYSYVVLRKGPRPSEKPQWPRCVRETLQRNKHVHLRLCTSDGKLENTVLFKQKNSKVAYKCAKHTNWGDLLPGKIIERSGN